MVTTGNCRSGLAATQCLLAFLAISAACGGKESTTPTGPTLGNRTFFSFVADPGSTVAAGQSGLSMELAPENSRVFAARAYGADGIIGSVAVVAIDPSNVTREISFGAPPGQNIAPGGYRNAVRSNTFQPGRPALNIGGGGLTCSETSGEFTVTVVELGPYISGTNAFVLERFHAVFERRCIDGRTGQLLPSVRGEVSIPHRTSD